MTTYNPGKTDILENGVYSKGRYSKKYKGQSNLRVLSETFMLIVNVEDGRSAQAVLMSALDGFNIIKLSSVCIKMNDKGKLSLRQIL